MHYSPATLPTVTVAGLIIQQHTALVAAEVALLTYTATLSALVAVGAIIRKVQS